MSRRSGDIESAFFPQKIPEMANSRRQVSLTTFG
jgi:hypothetical protein